MNKVGFNLLAWSTHISEALYPSIERLKTIGYDGIEFSLGNREPEAYKALGTFLSDLGMEATAVHALDADADPISPDPAVRQKAIDTLKQDLDLARLAGATQLCGPIHSAFANFSQAAPLDVEYGYSAEVLHAVGEYAETLDMTLAVEAINRFECYLCNTMEQLKRVCDLADHPRVKAMFDTHHANIEEKSFSDALDTIASHLVHVHISENDRGTPGEGHVPFADIFAKLNDLNYSGWFTIESFTRNDVDFANAINVWREYSAPRDIAEKGHALIRNHLKG